MHDDYTIHIGNYNTYVQYIGSPITSFSTTISVKKRELDSFEPPAKPMSALAVELDR